jgi:glycosyltransferase involved in cell wall biosynthesis
MNIPVLIPAYNPDLKLLSIVTDLVNLGFEKIIVVNDGSSQEYKPIFNKLLDINQCVSWNMQSIRKGAALKQGSTMCCYLAGG